MKSRKGVAGAQGRPAGEGLSDEEVEKWFATINKIREARFEASRIRPLTPKQIEERRAALAANNRLRSIFDGQKKFFTKT